ncbi:hypothetical protein ACSS6W_004228 [Trichoderma asperelloides]
MKTSTIAILAALGGLQTAVAQIISGTPVWVDATTCDPWAKSNGFPAAAGPGGLFTTAVGILGQIVDANLYRMNHPSKQSQTTLPANVLAWERYRLNSTYGAFFGNNTDTTPVALGVWEVVWTLWGIQYQWASTYKPYLLVMCDDAPYLSKSSNGSLVFTDPYNHATADFSRNPTLNLQLPTSGCATNGLSGYKVENFDNWTQYHVFCTKNFNLPLGFTNKGPVTFASGTTLETAGKSWLGALYTHALWSDGFGDTSTYPSVHGVAASHVIRNNRDSVLNTDSNKFFSIALMLDGLFWGSGVGQTSQQEFASLQKTAAGKKLIAAFGLTNIPVPARGITWASGWVPPNMNNEVVPMQPIPTA